jgi:hypothetical protein
VLFSAQLRQGRLTGNYAKVHCEKVQQEVRTRMHQLDDPVPAELAEAGARARIIAETLSGTWQDLSRHRTDSQEIDKIRQQAIRLEQQLSSLEAL